MNNDALTHRHGCRQRQRQRGGGALRVGGDEGEGQGGLQGEGHAVVRDQRETVGDAEDVGGVEARALHDAGAAGVELRASVHLLLLLLL